MTHDELREKVADALADAWEKEGMILHAADAVVAVALEEAARVAEREAYGFAPEMLTEHGVGYARACKEIAAAIRALGGKDE